MKASSVIQNGPAFFDRTSSARSPSVRGASFVSEAMARTHLQAEHAGRRVDVRYGGGAEIVRGASFVSEAMARTHLQAEHAGRRVDVEYVVEHELVRRAAIDVRGGGGE